MADYRGRVPGSELLRVERNQLGCARAAGFRAVGCLQHALCGAVCGHGAQRRDLDFPAPESEMNRSRTVTITASVLVIACLGGAVFILSRIDRMRSGATLEEVLFVSSPKMV